MYRGCFYTLLSIFLTLFTVTITKPLSNVNSLVLWKQKKKIRFGIIQHIRNFTTISAIGAIFTKEQIKKQSPPVTVRSNAYRA